MSQSIFDQMKDMGHEQVVFCHDPHSGLNAIIAIHNTTLGPALGGTRLWNYNTHEEGIVDALRLSRGMTYKAAISSLNLGGGKAVIIANPAQKSEALWRRYGKFVNSLNGKYITAEDVNTSARDMEYGKAVSEFIYSNVKGVIDQNKHLFETLWKKSLAAEKRIKEIEQGLPPLETMVVNTNEEVLSCITELIQQTKNGLCACSIMTGLQMINKTKPLLESCERTIRLHKEGKNENGIRLLTHIENNKEHTDLIKKFLSMGFYVRHLRNLPPINFGVSDRQLESTIDKMEGGALAHSNLHSTDPVYIQHFQSLFEDLWDSAIEAQERLIQIENGTDLEFTKVIENPIQSRNKFLQMLENAKNEILIIFPSQNYLILQKDTGFIDILKRKSYLQIKILSPNKDTLEGLLMSGDSSMKNVGTKNIAMREVIKQQNIRSIVLIVDKKYMLSIEEKNRVKKGFKEIMGLSTFSSSSPKVSSYVSIFETLWIQTEMFDNLKMANQKLIESEQIERDFVNTAAHELRTPMQAIAGYVELNEELLDNIPKNKSLVRVHELERVLDLIHRQNECISRNASRLNNLINNLLDVARLDSSKENMINLDLEKFDLINEIKDLIDAQLRQNKMMDKNIQVSFINETLNETCFVFADKSRVNQILKNLLDNAIKFSKNNGSIHIMIQKNYYTSKEIPDNHESNQYDKEIVYVAISDSGKGLSPDILPRLFEKFMTNSETGIGIGLYISKKLIEAMGGRIWAFNNSDGIGSTFVFSLPMIRIQ